MRTNGAIGKILAVLILILSINGQCRLIFAQSSQFQAIYTGFPIRDINWSADSQTLVFNNESANPLGVQTSNGGWFQYSITTKKLTQSNNWPLQPELTEVEQRLFSAAVSSNGKQTFVFLSPNKRYIVFAGDKATDTVESSAWRIQIGDRQLKQVASTSALVIQPFASTNDFNVFWNSDDTSFVVTSTDFSGFVLTRYVTNYEGNLTKLTLQTPHLNIDNQTYEDREPYAISGDGQFVLLKALKDDPNDPNLLLAKVVLWHPINHWCEPRLN